MNKMIFVLLLLSGCSTAVPVARSFPDAPEAQMEKCLPLIKLQEDAKLSDVTRTVVYNYSLHHECAAKVEMWQDWYKKQKKIFEDVK